MRRIRGVFSSRSSHLCRSTQPVQIRVGNDLLSDQDSPNDQSTCRIIRFGVQAGTVNGVALCRMFNRAVRGYRLMPKSSAPTMIRFIGSTNGSFICESWTRPKSRPSPTFPCPIRSSSG